MNIQISDTSYQTLKQAAQFRNITPEALIESFVSQLPIGYAKDEDEFFRALGLDDARIARVKAEAALLPADPDW